MPFAVYTPPLGAKPVGRYMPTPKKIGDITAWFKTARSVISSIPDPKVSDWFIRKAEATIAEVRFELQDTNGCQGVIVIDRTKRGLGA